MKTAKKLAISLGLTALALGFTAPQPAAAAGPRTALFAPTPAELGTKILEEMDRRAGAFTDVQYDASMSIFRGGVLKKTLVFKMFLKGVKKQLMNFTAPGDVAGMKVLLNDDALYTYLPDFKKARKVATHVKSQGFLGSAFHFEDQEMVLLSPFYDAEFVGKSGDEMTLKLTAKADKELTYPSLEVVIDATKGGVTVIRYYDGAGNHVREQLREDWLTLEGNQMPTTITMKDLKNGDHSEIRLSNITVNQGLEDDMFSRRMLLRG